MLYLGREEKPAIGFWIDEKFRNLRGIPDAPMLCKVGKMATTANGKKDRRIILVQATGKLDNMVGSKETTTFRKNGGFSVVHLYVSRLHLPIEIFVRERTTFCKDGREIPHCPMFLSRKRGSKIVQDEYQYDGEDENTTLLFRECSKEDRKSKLVDFPEGEYVCNTYSAFQYREKERYVLYLGREEKPAIGFWIDEKFRNLRGIPDAPMLCKVGKMATTANGKKDRRIVFCIAEEKQKTTLPTLCCTKQEKVLQQPPIEECFATTYFPGERKREAYIPPTFVESTSRTEKKEPLGDFVDICLLERARRARKRDSCMREKDCKDWFGTTNERLLEGKV